MGPTLGRAWRLAATTLLFAIFGVSGVISSLLVFPALQVLAGNSERRQRWSRTFVRLYFRSFVSMMATFGVCTFDIDAETRASLANARGKLVVGNHPTLIDALVLLAYIDQANCVVKSALWRNPFLTVGIRAANYISNENTEELMSCCEAALSEGQALIVFPEATRTVPGQPIRPQRGAATMALRAKVQVQIVHIDCQPVFLSRHVAWYRIPRRKPCFIVRAGVSLWADDFLRSGGLRSIAARQMTGVIARELNAGAGNEGAGVRAQTASH
jgi:1-acyl-sn-glycerol-3-phosphate acyltransferase